jgi:hypothetical protein
MPSILHFMDFIRMQKNYHNNVCSTISTLYILIVQHVGPIKQLYIILLHSQTGPSISHKAIFHLKTDI